MFSNTNTATFTSAKSSLPNMQNTPPPSEGPIDESSKVVIPNSNAATESQTSTPSAPSTENKITHVVRSTKPPYAIYTYKNPKTHVTTVIAKCNSLPAIGKYTDNGWFVDRVWEETHPNHKTLIEYTRALNYLRLRECDAMNGYWFDKNGDGWMVGIGVDTFDFKQIESIDEKKEAIRITRMFCDQSAKAFSRQLSANADLTFHPCSNRTTELAPIYNYYTGKQTGSTKISTESASLVTDQSITLEQMECMLKTLLKMNLLDSVTAKEIYTDLRNAINTKAIIPEFSLPQRNDAVLQLNLTLRQYYFELQINNSHQQNKRNKKFYQLLFTRNTSIQQIEMQIILKLLACLEDENAEITFSKQELSALSKLELNKIIMDNREALPRQFLAAESPNSQINKKKKPNNNYDFVISAEAFAEIINDIKKFIEIMDASISSSAKFPAKDHAFKVQKVANASAFLKVVETHFDSGEKLLSLVDQFIELDAILESENSKKQSVKTKAAIGYLVNTKNILIKEREADKQKVKTLLN